MAKEKRSVLDAIKEDINRSNNGAFKNFFRIRESGAKVRVRFLQNFEDCEQIVFHDKWNAFNHPCLEQYGKECPNCNNPEARTATLFCWNVYNYETKQVELFLYKANKATPIYSLMSIYEIIGDITKQDIVITRNGTGTGTTYQCTAVPKETDFDKKVKMHSEKKILAMCLEAFNQITPDDSYGDDDDDDEEEVSVNAKRKKAPAKKSKKQAEEYDEDDFDEDDDDEDEEPVKKKSKQSAKKTTKKRKVEEEDDDEDEEDDDDDAPFDLDDEDEDFDDDDEDDLPPPRKKAAAKGKSKRK